MSRTSGIAVLMVSVVVAIAMAHWLRLASRSASRNAPGGDAAEVAVYPVPSEARPARVSRGALQAGSLSLDVSVSSVPVNEILGTDLGPEDVPPLVNPATVSSSSDVAPTEDDMVVGIVVDGVPRAYPLSVLSYHWVINDVIDGRAVAVFWDPIAGAAAACQASIEGRRPEFGASGTFYQGNALYHDDRTTSLFLPLKGCFVTGPLADRRLKFLPLWRQEWSTWLERWPGSRVVSTDTGYERPYDRDPYTAVQTAGGQIIDYFAGNTMLVEPTRLDLEQRLPSKDWVLGFVTPAGKAHCCSLNDLPSDESEPYLDTGEARIARLPDGGARAALSGGVWPQQAVCFYFAWYGAHPETSVHGEPSGVDSDGR